MEPWKYALITVFALLIMIACVVFLILYYNRKIKATTKKLEDEKNKKIRELEERATNSFRAGREEAVSYYRDVIDRIPDDIKSLNNTSEKELLVSTVMALSSYGRRIDRIEDKLNCIYNYNSYIEKMNNIATDLEKKSTSLTVILNNTNSSLNGLTKYVSDADAGIKQMVTTLGNIGDINNQILSKLSELNSLSAELDKISVRQKNIIKDMNATFDVYGQAPMVKLHNIELSIANNQESIRKIIGDIATVCARIKSMDASLECIDSNVSTIFDTVNTIESNTSESSWYDTDDVYSEISELSGKIESLKSSVNDVYCKLPD